MEKIPAENFAGKKFHGTEEGGATRKKRGGGNLKETMVELREGGSE